MIGVAIRSLAACLLLTVLASSTAAAQGLRNRVTVGFSAGLQAPPDALSDRFQFERFVETATVEVDYGKDPGVFFDGGVGFRLWKAMGAAVAVSRHTHGSTIRVDARIPHPFFDDQLRDIAGSTDGVTRAETGVHAQLTYTIESNGPLMVTLSGGPSLLDVERELVTAVRYSESFPFDEATFTTSDTRRSGGSAIGFNVGADVTWMLGRRFGVGGMVRYTRATLDLEWTDGTNRRTIADNAGGVQGAAGVRVRF